MFTLDSVVVGASFSVGRPLTKTAAKIAATMQYLSILRLLENTTV